MRNVLVLPLAIAAAFSLPATALHAQTNQQGGSMSGMQMHGSSGMQNMSPIHKEFTVAMDKMNKGMMQGMMNPNPDQSWVEQMIAHHQGAIELSDVILRHTTNAVVSKEARKTKAENEKSLSDLQAILKK